MMNSNLRPQELESVYDALAESIDQAGEQDRLYLVKVALCLADLTGNADAVLNSFRECLEDL